MSFPHLCYDSLLVSSDPHCTSTKSSMFTLQIFRQQKDLVFLIFINFYVSSQAKEVGSLKETGISTIGRDFTPAYPVVTAPYGISRAELCPIFITVLPPTGSGPKQENKSFGVTALCEWHSGTVLNTPNNKDWPFIKVDNLKFAWPVGFREMACDADCVSLVTIQKVKKRFSMFTNAKWNPDRRTGAIRTRYAVSAAPGPLHTLCVNASLLPDVSLPHLWETSKVTSIWLSVVVRDSLTAQ